jgi:hypothetical protein
LPEAPANAPYAFVINIRKRVVFLKRCRTCYTQLHMSSCLRTPPIEEAYHQYRASHDFDAHCPLCEKPAITQFVHWKIVPNDFPYDKLAKAHNMIVPLRHTVEADFTPEEVEELRQIKHRIMVSPEYDFVMEITEPHKTIPPHFHLHIIALKDNF